MIIVLEFIPYVHIGFLVSFLYKTFPVSGQFIQHRKLRHLKNKIKKKKIIVFILYRPLLKYIINY
jgi:hypothetical protein